MLRFHAELRASAVADDTLVGYAAVFGQVAPIRGGYEAIAPGAFDEVLASGEDVVALRDHNPTYLLGRTKAGTLRLASGPEGLEFAVDLPATSYARDLRELVARGDLAGASFGFLPGKDELSHAPDGRALRTHTSIARLLDVSAVTLPAYDGTTVTLRSMTFDTPDRATQLIRARHRARHQTERRAL